MVYYGNVFVGGKYKLSCINGLILETYCDQYVMDKVLLLLLLCMDHVFSHVNSQSLTFVIVSLLQSIRFLSVQESTEQFVKLISEKQKEIETCG